MANGDSEVGVDAPAGGFVQLLTPAGERIDSVTSADGTTYSFTVTATDPAGNSAIDDNGGLCHTFDTEEVPDAFTEEFGPFDMSGLRIIYHPNASLEAYEACTKPGDGTFPTSPTGGTTLPLSDDDSELVPEPNGWVLWLCALAAVVLVGRIARRPRRAG